MMRESTPEADHINPMNSGRCSAAANPIKRSARRACPLGLRVFAAVRASQRLARAACPVRVISDIQPQSVHPGQAPWQRSIPTLAGADGHTQALQSRPDVLVPDLEQWRRASRVASSARSLNCRRGRGPANVTFTFGAAAQPYRRIVRIEAVTLLRDNCGQCHNLPNLTALNARRLHASCIIWRLSTAAGTQNTGAHACRKDTTTPTG